MLVLSRKKNESIVIDDNIIIYVVEIREDKVRLGVECPKEIPVHRKEVYDAIHRGEVNQRQSSARELETRVGGTITPAQSDLNQQNYQRGNY